MTDAEKRDYRTRVLLPYKNERRRELVAGLNELKKGATLPTAIDLVEMYDMVGVDTDAEIVARFAGVEDVFDRLPTSLNLREVSTTVLDFHRRLAKGNDDLATAAFWRRLKAARSARAAQGLSEVVDAAEQEAGHLKVLLASDLKALAEQMGAAGRLSSADVEAAVRARGIDVVEAAAAPTAVVPTALLTALNSTSLPSVVDALYLEQPPAAFTVVDGFRAAGVPPLSVTLVKESRDVAERRPATDDENGAVLKALNVLRALPDDRALEQVVRAWFFELGRPSAVGGSAVVALRRLTDTRLDRRDAARIVLHHASEGTARDDFPKVQEKLAAGELRGARLLLDALCDAAPAAASDERVAASKAVESAERRLEELRQRAEGAVAAADPATARRVLQDALVMCSDDEALAQLLTALPPSAPTHLAVSASPDGRTVAVTWDAGFGAGSDVQYRVVCKAGSAPASLHDGVVVADGLTATRAEHRDPEVATRLHYAVGALRGDTASPLVTLPITVLPAVGDVRVQADEVSVALRWDPPRGARDVRVVQVSPDGRQAPVRPQHPGSLRVDGLETGATYTYLLTALYAGAGGELVAEPRRVTATPRGSARPVPFVNLSAVADAVGGTEVLATWRPLLGFDVEVWTSTAAPRWPYGARVPVVDLAAEARRLVGTAAGGGRRPGLRAQAEPGLLHCFAVTRDGDTGIIGHCTQVCVCPRLTGVTAERFHDVVVLSWPWPGQGFDVHATWDGERAGGRTITRPQYSREGGLRVPVGTGRSRIVLRTVSAAADETWTSPETVVDVDGAAPAVRYSTVWHRRITRTPHAVTLTFTSEERLSDVRVAVTAQTGHVMPHGKDSGVVLAEQSLDLAATGTAAVTVSVKGLGPHFWVRAFAARPGTVRLVDPPARDLRGA